MRLRQLVTHNLATIVNYVKTVDSCPFATLSDWGVEYADLKEAARALKVHGHVNTEWNVFCNIYELDPDHSFMDLVTLYRQASSATLTSTLRKEKP